MIRIAIAVAGILAVIGLAVVLGLLIFLIGWLSLELTELLEALWIGR